ncbi:MATE family efflux transporter [Pontivivens insulae]|uniref:Multidrug resistance protein NorM n=1 Tax=Pontivivens insulae TaxID=1639689 RepID=A0A2R8AE12_9RHOB|nr:MATE family efflux transporter [Pontivivens insulae]RED14325.1 MATE family multidrug resistance protein [Pontivivens insulae]SPF30402.1 Multidrug resistance protein NorM [Pontivivens insulae]
MTDATLPNHTIADHIRRTLTLAWPVMLSRLGLVGFATADVIVLGRAGAQELADYALGLAIYDSLMAAMAGLLLGVGVLTARETGAARDGAAGTILRRGILYGLLVGVGMGLLLQFAESGFLLLQQEPGQAASAAAVTRMVAFALPFFAVFFCCASWLEALHHPKVGMWAVALANISNLAFNILFVFVFDMGAVGAALATVLNSLLLAAGLWLYIHRIFPQRNRYGVGERNDAPPAIEQYRIGFGGGLSFTFEAGAFVMMTLFVGWLGTLALATHAVLFQLLATVFMAAFGIASAVQVRVGNAWGRGDARGMALAGWTGLGMCTAMLLVAMVAFLLLPLPALRLFTTDPAVLAAAAPVMIWMTLALLCDGNQTIMSHACRGRGDTWVPTALHLVSYWVVMVPAGYLFAIRWEHGVAGIYQGILVASIVSVTLMSLRFRVLTKRGV